MATDISRRAGAFVVPTQGGSGATTQSAFLPSVQITSPAANALIRGVGFTVAGTADCDRVQIVNGDDTITDAIDSIDKVEVQLGSGAFKLATATGPVGPIPGVKRWSSWTCAFNPITGVVNDSLKITARVTAGTAQSTAVRTIQVDRTPPVLTVTTTVQTVTTTVQMIGALPTTGTAAFEIKGTATDSLSTITTVERAIDGSTQFVAAIPKAANDWSEWRVPIALTAAGPHTVAIRARDQEGNVSPSRVVSIEVVLPFQPKDPADVFGRAAYLNDLLELSQNRVRTAANGVAVSRATLTATFFQPFDALTQPTNRAIAEQPISHARACVEALRKYLASRGQSAPVVAESVYRQAAYERVLLGIGTSSQEIRLARVADPPVRAALAARLGFDLRPVRPDQLDELMLPPAQLTEQSLEKLFGLTSTTRDQIAAGGPAQSSLLTWQLARLRATWQEQDVAARVFGDAPLPVIDPDLISEADLKTRAAGDSACDLLQARRAELTTKLNQIKAARTTPTIAGFNATVTQFLCPSDELISLAGQHRQGQDITPRLNALRISLRAFLHLSRLQTLATAGTILDAEWEEVYAILLQVQKVRGYAAWQAQEQAPSRGIVLGPDFFVLPDPSTRAAISLPAWRATAVARRTWQETLRARTNQQATTIQALQEIVDAAEAATLPALRDALVAASDPANPAGLAARRGQDLILDLQSSGRQRTTRLDLAIETIQGVLFAVRVGRFEAPHPAAPWVLTASSAYSESKFDEDWRWLGAYSTWRAAMSVFLYPESYLQPSLRPDAEQTQAFRALVGRLREAARMSPVRARQEAQLYLDALRTESLTPALPADLRNPPPAGKPLFKLTDELTDADLAARGTFITTLFAGITNPHLAPVALKELFFYVPLLLATELQRSGQYLASLDWFQTVYAFNLDGDQRKVYTGLKLEAAITTQYQRPLDWPREGSTPHLIVRDRANALTRFTLLSLVQCFLAFADGEFTHETAESLPRARGLYETAGSLLALPELQPPSAAVDPLAAQLPPNPVLAALRQHVESSLFKLRSGRNVAGLERQATGLTGRTDSSVVVRCPTPYRYAVLIERAKRLVSTAQQVEAAFLAALEKRDAEAYNLLKARQDLEIGLVTVTLQGLRVGQARDGISLAELQQGRAEIQADHFAELLDERVTATETAEVTSILLGAAAVVLGGIATGGAVAIVGGALAATGALAGGFASQERRREDWQLQLALAQQDVAIGAQQVEIAIDQVNIALQEMQIAGLQADHAADTVEFLANKFTSADLFDWMSGVLERVYSYFLQQATGVARLAEHQLGFERQETPPSFIQTDYWDVSDPSALGAGAGQTPDRRGLTGAERLLQDITRLDEYAFETDRRKLQLARTLSLAQLAPVELQRFRETGLLVIGTPMSLFDHDFPGHYLRLVRRVKVSVVALVPPTEGIRATLSTIGSSRVTVAGDAFQTVVVNHGPESVALTSPRDATGLFDLDLQSEMRLPFEGIGVDTVWELRMPKAANPFDFRSIADVLLTIEYTALDSPGYREQVVRSLSSDVRADRAFSFRQQFADQWYDLHNPDQTDAPMRVRFQTTRGDFPPNVDDLRIEQVTLYLARSTTSELADPLPIELRLAPGAGGAQLEKGGVAASTDGLYSTRTNAADWRAAVVGASPVGGWTLALPDTSAARALFQEEAIDDILLVVSYSASEAPWPA